MPGVFGVVGCLVRVDSVWGEATAVSCLFSSVLGGYAEASKQCGWVGGWGPHLVKWVEIGLSGLL